MPIYIHKSKAVEIYFNSGHACDRWSACISIKCIFIHVPRHDFCDSKEMREQSIPNSCCLLVSANKCSSFESLKAAKLAPYILLPKNFSNEPIFFSHKHNICFSFYSEMEREKRRSVKRFCFDRIEINLLSNNTQ